MKKLPRLTALAAASVLALGSVACSDDDSSENISDENGAEDTEEPDEEGDELDDDAEEDEAGDDESVVDALVGVWEADPEEVGPHGSELTVEDNGDASYSSSASQRGPHEGTIVDDGERVVFEGVVEETETEGEWEILYNPEEDAMTMISESDEHTHHTRVE